MSTLPQFFVTQWDSAIRTESAQQNSRLRSTVTDRGHIAGETFTINFLGDDGSLLDANNVRHSDTVFSEPDHQVRMVNMMDFFKAYPLDRNDIPKMQVNPVAGGAYMALLMKQKNRRIDDIIYRAARGAQLRKDGSSIALPATQKIAAGGTSFTKAKLLATRKIFRRNEADKYNGETLTILYNDEMLDDILSDTTLTSADFMAVKMLQNGDVSGNWMGFNWVPFQAMEQTGGIYYTVAYASSGIHFGTGFEEGDVTKRPDKKNLWQVSMAASYGAGREDEKKVVEIAFTA